MHVRRSGLVTGELLEQADARPGWLDLMSSPVRVQRRAACGAAASLPQGLEGRAGARSRAGSTRRAHPRAHSVALQSAQRPRNREDLENELARAQGWLDKTSSPTRTSCTLPHDRLLTYSTGPPSTDVYKHGLGLHILQSGHHMTWDIGRAGRTSGLANIKTKVRKGTW